MVKSQGRGETQEPMEQAQSAGEVTRLLVDFRNGEPEAEARLMELIYRELQMIAAGLLRREQGPVSVQTRDLVHDAYLRLIHQPATLWRDRAHFFRCSAHVMRQVLIDRVRRRRADKRGGGAAHISLDGALDLAETLGRNLLGLDEALSRLESLDPRQCQVVEMRFFAGMSDDEIGEVLGVSCYTVRREWRLARAWLYQELYG